MKEEKINTLQWVCISAVVISFFGCISPNSNSGTLNEVGTYPKQWWGEWIRMDTGDIWYIGSNYITGPSSSDNISLSRQSGNVFEVTNNNGRKYYLYASRTANSSFTGNVAGIETNPSMSMARAGKGWIDVVVEDLNSGDKTTVKTDEDGGFEVEEAIPGDDYQITPEDGSSVVVTPTADGDDIGTISVTGGGVNFKTTIAPGLSNTDMMRIYVDTDYSFNITLTNIGSADCLAPRYMLALPADLTLASGESATGYFSSIEPGKTKTITRTLRCTSLSGDAEYKKIGITIWDDLNQKTWDDSVSLKFNRYKIPLNICSNGAVSGVVIVPGGKCYSFKTSSSYYSSNNYTASLEVPRYSGKDYLLVFSGATADTEAIYSVGVGSAAPILPTDLFGVPGYARAHEPNNIEIQAQQLNEGGTVLSYLHKNDIDYFKIKF